MDFKTLKTFQAIVKYGSFNRAAQVMNYVQSTVTMQMQKLEAELGVQLLERGKEISLTAAGRLFYDQSLQIVKQMEHLQADLSDMKSGEAGHVRIGATEPTASCRLPAILGKFMSRHPNIRISVEIASTKSLGESVLKGDLDFALCTAPSIGSDLYFEPLFQEEFAVIMPEEHPLAVKKVIEPEDLREHRLLITSATCPYRRKLEMALQERGGETLVTMEIGSMSALKFYVESKLGIALVPSILSESLAPGTVARPVGDSLIRMTSGTLCKESAYPFQHAALKLYQFLKQELVNRPVTYGL
ncbi:MAG: LysR family transcriptional regulator [Cohnella sp.]|nr:LysR family transcriptional regulator [Cohnella sp.]